MRSGFMNSTPVCSVNASYYRVQVSHSHKLVIYAHVHPSFGYRDDHAEDDRVPRGPPRVGETDPATDLRADASRRTDFAHRRRNRGDVVVRAAACALDRAARTGTNGNGVRRSADQGTAGVVATRAHLHRGGRRG